MKKTALGLLCVSLCIYTIGCTKTIKQSSSIENNTTASSNIVVEQSSPLSEDPYSAPLGPNLYPDLAYGRMFGSYYFAAGPNSTEYTLVNLGDEFLGMRLLAVEHNADPGEPIYYFAANWAGEVTLTGTLTNAYTDGIYCPAIFVPDEASLQLLPFGKGVHTTEAWFYPDFSGEELNALLGLDEWKTVRCEVTITEYHDLYLEAGVHADSFISNIRLLEVLE